MTLAERAHLTAVAAAAAVAATAAVAVAVAAAVCLSLRRQHQLDGWSLSTPPVAAAYSAVSVVVVGRLARLSSPIAHVAVDAQRFGKARDRRWQPEKRQKQQKSAATSLRILCLILGQVEYIEPSVFVNANDPHAHHLHSHLHPHSTAATTTAAALERLSFAFSSGSHLEAPLLSGGGGSGRGAAETSLLRGHDHSPTYIDPADAEVHSTLLRRHRHAVAVADEDAVAAAAAGAAAADELSPDVAPLVASASRPLRVTSPNKHVLNFVASTRSLAIRRAGTELTVRRRACVTRRWHTRMCARRQNAQLLPKFQVCDSAGFALIDCYKSASSCLQSTLVLESFGRTVLLVRRSWKLWNLGSQRSSNLRFKM